MRKAVALDYNPGQEAPVIVAKGRGELAERIVRIAEENGVTIVNRGSVAERLYLFDPGTLIPEDLYEVIAQLYAYLINVDEAS